jgi:hypothetical protein
LTHVELPFYDGSQGVYVQMKREFVINRHGKDYVLYAGLLDEAHSQGLSAIKTTLLQAPTAQNAQVAIVMAEVTTEKGSFTGIGDASPDNVSRAMANALIRLAETRAKARALRDAINVSMVSLEELGDGGPEPLPVDGSGESAPRLSAVAPVVPLIPRQSPASAPPQLPQVPQMPQGQMPGPGAAPVSGLPQGEDGALEPARPRRIREAGPAAGSGSGKAPVDGSPATPTQVETIAKLARSIGRIVPTGDLTRAAASELITRLSEERYGARRS